MDWKQATSLFIVVFIIINAALGFIYYEKVERAKVVEEVKTEPVDFQAEGIEVGELPDENETKMNIVSGKSKKFESAASALSSSDKTTKTKHEETLDKSVKLSSIEVSNINKGMQSLLKNKVFHGDEYVLSGIDRKNKKLYYDQVFGKYPILNNDKAQLTFTYNDSNEVTKYKQTYLEDLKEGLGKNNDKKQVRPAREALEALYYNTDLKKGDKVSSVRLGYYSIVREVSGQVLKPTWQIAIVKPNETVEMYYVDAVSPEQTILR